MAGLLPILLPILLKLILKVGLPGAIDWLKKRFPRIPWDEIAKIIGETNGRIEDIKGEHKKKIKECFGNFCPTDTKGLGD